MTECYNIVISETAEIDLHAAYEWIRMQAHEPASAAKWVAGLLEAIRSLELLPERCALAPESAWFEQDIRVRFYRAGSIYRILFTIQAGEVGAQAGQVVILYIRHAARQFVTPEEPQ